MLTRVAASTTQPAPEPDDMERLRAARGEGWQWNRIQEESCPQCGLNPAAMDPGSLGKQVVGLAGKWHLFLVEAGDRLRLGLDRDAPTVPMFNPGQEEWASYNELDAEELANELEANAQRVADILGGIDASGWSRTVINDR